MSHGRYDLDYAFDHPTLTIKVWMPSSRGSRRDSVYYYRRGRGGATWYVERVFEHSRRIEAGIPASWTGPFATALDARTALLLAREQATPGPD